MKKLSLIISFAFSLPCFCQQSQPVLSLPSNNQIQLSKLTDTLQYSIGSYVAQWINSNGFLINNPALFLKGMDDVFRNYPRLVNDSISTAVVVHFQQVFQQERNKKSEQQLFTGLKDKPGVGTMPNGVYYIILKHGEGQHPRSQDSVVLNIRGAIASGAVFEDTYKKGTPVITTPENMIPGVAAILPMMGAGSKWQLYIPAAMAYGTQATAGIPSNSALIIDLELLGVLTLKK